MATDISPLRIIRPHEIRIEATKSSLSNTIGLIIRTNKALWVFLKARKTSSLDFRPSEQNSIHFFAIADSVTDGRDIESQVHNFVADLKSIFSIKELNLAFLTDFLCRLLKNNLFRKDDERPLPVEMAVIQINRLATAAVGITTVDYMGDSNFPESNFDLHIFGCPDPKTRAEIAIKLAAGLKTETSNEEFEKIVQRLLEEFPGDILVWQLDFERPTEINP